MALRELGEVERRVPDVEAARRHYEEAVLILRGLDEPLRLAHAVRHLGDLHRGAGRGELAEGCYDEALAIYRHDRRTPPLDLANALRGLALYASLGVAAGADESAARIAQLNRRLAGGQG